MLEQRQNISNGVNNPAENIQVQPKFRGEVLNKVYRIWLFRKLLPVLIAEVVIFSVVLYLLGRTVFIQRVLENGLKVFFLNPTNIIPFLENAFSHAALLTKTFAVTVVIILALLIRHLTQGFLRLILVRENYFARTK